MRVVVCGAGQVGFSIASYLAREDNDVTIIDSRTSSLAAIRDQIDVNVIEGHASCPDILARAGANDADMLIAVTDVDEVNMVACQVGHSLFNIPKKIARVRDRRYLNPAWSNLFGRANLPIDVIISPEVEIAKAMVMRLAVPGTTNIIPLAAGRAYLCGIYCDANCPLIETPLRQLTALFPDVNVEVVAIYHEGRVVVPTSFDQIKPGDEVYVVVDANHLTRVLSAFGHDEQKARSVIILGGGHVGTCLVDEIKSSGANVSIKLIERDPARAAKIAERHGDILVVAGDGVDRQILEETGIRETEALACVTNEDETNILASLLARQFGVGRTITLIQKNTYSSLVSPLGLGAIVSPRAITVSTIMQHVRRGRIRAVHNVLDGNAELIEAEAPEGCDIINTPIRDLILPDDVLIGGILRGGETLIMPRPDTVIRAGDHVMIFAANGTSKAVEKIFSVKVNLF